MMMGATYASSAAKKTNNSYFKMMKQHMKAYKQQNLDKPSVNSNGDPNG